MKYSEVFWKGVTQIEGDNYERCRFRPLSLDSICPDYEFEVSLEDPKTGNLINRVTIRTHADDDVLQYIRTHPLWRTDCRPFLLMQIQELMWGLKLLRTEYKNPSKRQIGFAYKQGGTLYLDITAEVFVDCGGTHIIQFVNYANTHVLDQLHKVYKEHPMTKPSDEYIEKFKENFFRDYRKKKIEKKKEQKRLFKLRRRKYVEREPIQVFLDESGDIGFRSIGEPYIVTAYVVPTSASEAIRQELNGILVRHWPVTHPKELHFNKIPTSKLHHVIADVAGCLQSFPGACFCYVGEKSGFLSYLLRCEAEHRKLEEKPIITNWAYTLNESPSLPGRAILILLLEELLFHVAVEVTDIQTSMRIYHDRKHREWMNEALQTAYQRSKSAIDTYSTDVYGRKLPLSRSFKIIESSVEPCLWISDWICWELTKWFRGQNWSSELEKCFSKITFISFDDLGKKILIDKPQGKLLAEFPDRPREIGSV